MTVRVITGDCRDVLRTLPDESVHCVVTSPPYFGLRDYGTAQWEGGDAACDHLAPVGGGFLAAGLGDCLEIAADKVLRRRQQFRDQCRHCGAARIDSQIGLESSPEAYVAELVAVFREVRRVLRKDGTLWLNLGDSYAAGKTGRADHGSGDPSSKLGPNRDGLPGGAVMGPVRQRNSLGIAAKQLIMIPARVALALQADGWWLRQDIIWSKPNPMPESVTDRCTKAHEYLFLLSKSERYYYDAAAIAEAAERAGDIPGGGLKHSNHKQELDRLGLKAVADTRNKRSVWTVATAPYAEAHFATFPPALIEPCIKAGTSEKGCCAQCGVPWVRQTEDRIVRVREGSDRSGDAAIVAAKGRHGSNSIFTTGSKTVPDTIGWSPSCACNAATVPCTVLDPFFGAGTTGLVADRLQRNCIGIDLNKSYAVMASNRITDDAPLLSEVR